MRVKIPVATEKVLIVIPFQRPMQPHSASPVSPRALATPAAFPSRLTRMTSTTRGRTAEEESRSSASLRAPSAPRESSFACLGSSSTTTSTRRLSRFVHWEPRLNDAVVSSHVTKIIYSSALPWVALWVAGVTYVFAVPVRAGLFGLC